MNIKKLTFTEVNLDGKNNHQWQGIMVYCDDLMIFHIHFYPKKNGSNDKSYFHMPSSKKETSLSLNLCYGQSVLPKSAANTARSEPSTSPSQ